MMGNTEKYAVLFFSILVIPLLVSGITTKHHDKPEEVALSKLSSKPTPDKSPAINVTLSTSERQKRLLPYANFYLSRGFNQPLTYSSYQEAPRFELVIPKGSLPPHNKYITYAQPHGNVETEQLLYQSNSKFTPFLESNALPGPFTPMIRNQPQRVQFVNPPQHQQKVPNYSEIYDKLAQLKLQQQGRVPSYVENYRVSPGRFNNKPQVNYEEQPYKPIEPTRTIIETYTATNIDIPYSQQSYEQLPSPIKNYENLQSTKPFVQQQVAVDIPHTSFSVPVYEDQAPPVQYHQQRPKQAPRKPYIVIQKAIESRPPKFQNEYEPISKPIIIIQRKPNRRPEKPIPVTIIDENRYVADKYISAPKFGDKFIPIQKLRPIEQPYEPQVQEPIIQHEPTPPLEPLQQTYHPTPHYGPVSPPAKYQEYQTDLPVTVAPERVTENTHTLSQILKHLQDTNTLPHTLTPDNIDNSIRTLVKILGALRKKQKVIKPIVVPDENFNSAEIENEAGVGISGHPEEIPGTITQSFPADTLEGGTPGKPGVDYPALSTIPQTSFNCKMQRYKGFFGDPDTNCQVWHYCDLNGGQASFLCPNGTIFSQVALTCDWWYNVKCASTPQLYVLNERLYKYIIPLSPKFPEDYSGPLVDKYLALKFQEMEEKMTKEKQGKQESKEEQKNKENEGEDNEDYKDGDGEKNLGSTTVKTIEAR